jgi:hypothetical protein
MKGREMDMAGRLMQVLVICCACSVVSHTERAGGVNGPDNTKETGVTIELTKLEVTGSSVGLSYDIRNGSEHDVWVCSKVSSIPFEAYLTHDEQTLLIRKRLEVPCDKIWRGTPTAGTYIRLSPGAAQPESLRLDLPVTPKSVYATVDAAEVAQTVQRLALEIGYYDGDLPALVRSIFEVADKFSPESWNLDPNLREVYFRGLAVRSALSGFDVINKDPYGSGRVYVEYSHRALTGERVLRMEINGVAIPY